MDLQLEGKRALVMGGSRGIGKAVARALVREGSRVAIAARNAETVQRSATELSLTPGGVVGVVCDASDDASVRFAVEDVARTFGGIDILVNCAALPLETTLRGVAEIEDSDFLSELNVKVLGYLRCIRAVIRHMPRGGRIVNVSGLAARQTGSIVGSVRNVSVAALTKNVSDELAGSGITAVVVHPGMTRTEAMSSRLAAFAQALRIDEEEAERRVASQNALGRIIGAEEVAEVIVFLASPRAMVINGDSVAVGGGVPGAIHY